MTIAMCDDEKIICSQVEKLVKNQEPNCDIKLFDSGEELFFIKLKGRNIILNRKDILYIESQNRMVNFHTTKEILNIYFDMRELEKRLGKGFYCCHRGYIVNMGYVIEYGKDSISLINGDSIYLSRRKYMESLSFLIILIAKSKIIYSFAVRSISCR